MGSRNPGLTRRSIWRLPARDGKQIKDHLREQGIDGAAAAQIAALHTRDRKETVSPEEVLQRQPGAGRTVWASGGPRRRPSARNGQHRMQDPEMQAQRAVTWARDHCFERFGLCRIAARSLKRARARHGKRNHVCPDPAGVRERRIGAGSSGKFHRLELANNSLRCDERMGARRLLAGCRKANRARLYQPIPCWFSPHSERIANAKTRHPGLNASRAMRQTNPFSRVEKLWV